MLDNYCPGLVPGVLHAGAWEAVADLGKTWARFGHLWPESGRLRATLAEFGPFVGQNRKPPLTVHAKRLDTPLGLVISEHSFNNFAARARRLVRWVQLGGFVLVLVLAACRALCTYFLVLGVRSGDILLNGVQADDAKISATYTNNIGTSEGGIPGKFFWGPIERAGKHARSAKGWSRRMWPRNLRISTNIGATRSI